MDSAGGQAHKRAVQQEEAAFPPSRGPDGRFRPVAQLGSMEDAVIGGWVLSSSRPPSLYTTTSDGEDREGNVGAPPARPLSQRFIQTGYPFVRPPSPSNSHVPPSSDENPLSQLRPVERTRALNLKRGFMDPFVQFVCGPLLRYDTIDQHGAWHGAALIVTADAGSIYEPCPTLKYRWDPKSGSLYRQSSIRSVRGVDLGPHPADPMAQHYRSQEDDGHSKGSTILERRALGTELYVYNGRSGTYTFWRFLIQIPLSDSEMKIQYSINDGLEMDFFVPGRQQAMRLAAYSCNGFSAGVNTDEFRGPGFQTGYDPVWVDLLAKHGEQPLHLLVGGGDQLYCDGVSLEPEMLEWVNHRSRKEKMHYPLTQEMSEAIDRFYFNHYCQSFRSGAFARANSSIPMLNMLGEMTYCIHPVMSSDFRTPPKMITIDGFGSYPDELQRSPVFNRIGSRGYFFFLLFQCFINVSKDGTDDRSHVFKSTIIGAHGAYVPYPSHSILTPIGPTAWMLMLDCRAERKLGQVCSEEEYARVFKRMNELPSGVEHLIIQLGIPIVYLHLSLLESVLSSSLGKLGCLAGLVDVNHFNGDAELLDDLNDHWTSKHHMVERNYFIERLQEYALKRRIRISFLSGDVHCAGVGVLNTLPKHRFSSAPAPASDHRYMLNVVSSAIVNTPPGDKVLKTVHFLAKWRHETLHYANTDESMYPLFEKDADGSKPKGPFIMGRRNWCFISLNQPSGDLAFEIRVERKQGHGETVGYSILAPPPRWTAKN